MSTTTGRFEKIYDLAEPCPKLSWQFWVSILVPAGILAYLFFFFPYAAGYGYVRQTIFTRISVLYESPDWEHCWMVPLAAGIIIFLRRRELLALPVVPSWTGLPVLLFGFAMYWAGYRLSDYYPGYVALQVLLAGFILLMFGWKWMLELSFPWMFLTFMWPLLFLDNMVAFPLRLIMSEASVTVLNVIGVDAIKRGTSIISAPDAVTGAAAGAIFSVDVADPCSGIRSLFALMMVSALYGYFALNSWWKRWILFFCSIPLAVLGNLFRILMLTFGTIALGPEVAIGTLEDPTTFHMAAGFVVFAIALGGMLGITWILKGGWKAWNSPLPPSGEPPASSNPADPISAKPATAQDIY